MLNNKCNIIIRRAIMFIKLNITKIYKKSLSNINYKETIHTFARL